MAAATSRRLVVAAREAERVPVMRSWPSTREVMSHTAFIGWRARVVPRTPAPDARDAHQVLRTPAGIGSLTSPRDYLAGSRADCEDDHSNARREFVQQPIERVGLLPLDRVTGIGDHLNLAPPKRGSLEPPQVVKVD